MSAPAETVTITVDGRLLQAPIHATLAAVLLNEGYTRFRASVVGSDRAPLCGMGICFECRVRVDGIDQVRACMEPVRAGMEVITGG
jgi:D-hydroxyproline dehydrogenase subunit gamma